MVMNMMTARWYAHADWMAWPALAQRPVAMPFLKFFNYGESNGADVDWSRPVRVMDKGKQDPSPFHLHLHHTFMIETMP